MQCINCNKSFERFEKGYRRTSLITKTRHEGIIEEVIGSRITPKVVKADTRFVCPACEKLLKSAIVGKDAKRELFVKTKEGTYISRKRERSVDVVLVSPQHKKCKTSPRVSTPLKTKSFPRMSNGAKALSNYEYKRGFRWYLNRYKAARKAFRYIIKRTVRRDVNCLLKGRNFPLTQKASVAAFKGLDWDIILRTVRRKVPYLYSALVACATRQSGEHSLTRGRSSSTSVKPVLGTVIAMLLKQTSPLKASLLQTMNAVHMWRAGAKRGLLRDFNHLGFTVGIKGLLGTLDVLTKEFDTELRQWRDDLESHLYPDDTRQPVDVPTPGASTDEESSASASLASSSVADEDEDEWSDMDSDSESDYENSNSEACSPVVTTDNMPKGYTLCWDNVGRQIKARHQTRNYGSKYLSWALAYVAKNRINTTIHTDDTVIAATEVPLQSYFLTTNDINTVKDRLKNMISQILVCHLECFEHLRDVPSSHIPHKYSAESSKKSELFNIGVLDENPCSTSGVINIVDSLHGYVPRKDSQHLHKLITWGDGLSCERHVDAQNARSNASTSLERLEGLEPSPQEFHKRMLLMQDTMDLLFDGKSANNKGTLFHLKNVFNQRSVSKNVTETFNYVSEFLKFVTHGYVLLFALDALGRDSLVGTYSTDDDDSRQLLDKISTTVLDKIWCQPNQYSLVRDNNEDYSYCVCKEDLEDEGEPMIQCENQECNRGLWFHFECVGISEENVPSGTWFCSDECRKQTEHYPYCLCKTFMKDEPMVACDGPTCSRGEWFHAKCIGIKELPGEDDPWYCSAECRKRHRGKRKATTTREGAVDRKFEYSKALVWRGLNDLVRRDAVRENDGPMMITYWKMDMQQFANSNHYKYFILTHRLITSVNGWLPKRLREDLIWNRTVNLKGGKGNNNEMDLVNEFLNKEFKESISSVGSKITEDTLQRHGKLAGGVGQHLDTMYRDISGSHRLSSILKTENDRKEDMELFISILKPESLVHVIPGRSHKAFQTISSDIQIKNVAKFHERIQQLSKKLDKRRHVVAN